MCVECVCIDHRAVPCARRGVGVATRLRLPRRVGGAEQTFELLERHVLMFSWMSAFLSAAFVTKLESYNLHVKSYTL